MMIIIKIKMISMIILNYFVLMIEEKNWERNKFLSAINTLKSSYTHTYKIPKHKFAPKNNFKVQNAHNYQPIINSK